MAARHLVLEQPYYLLDSKDLALMAEGIRKQLGIILTGPLLAPFMPTAQGEGYIGILSLTCTLLAMINPRALYYVIVLSAVENQYYDRSIVPYHLLADLLYRVHI